MSDLCFFCNISLALLALASTPCFVEDGAPTDGASVLDAPLAPPLASAPLAPPCVVEACAPTDGARDVDSLLDNFLQKNKLNTSDIDAVMIGLNGDLNHDYRYHQIIDTHFPEQTILTYKNCVGEYPTASGFALWLTSNILVTKKIPKSCLYKSGNKQIKRILIYNHYFGKLHGFILVEGIK